MATSETGYAVIPTFPSMSSSVRSVFGIVMPMAGHAVVDIEYILVGARPETLVMGVREIELPVFHPPIAPLTVAVRVSLPQTFDVGVSSRTAAFVVVDGRPVARIPFALRTSGGTWFPQVCVVPVTVKPL